MDLNGSTLRKKENRSRSRRSRHFLSGVGAGAGALMAFYLEPEPESEPKCFPGAGAGAVINFHGSASLVKGVVERLPLRQRSSAEHIGTSIPLANA